jgi:tripeptidyl-peptidase-1
MHMTERRAPDDHVQQKYHVWEHTDSGESIVRTTSYSLPGDLHEHIDVIQPTTMFSRPRKARSTFIWSDDEPASADLANAPAIVDAVSGSTVDASCNSTITIHCLQQLYNFAGFKPSSKNNSIGITSYLGQFANLQDLRSFYADQRPDALGSSFKYISVNSMSAAQAHTSSTH